MYNRKILLLLTDNSAGIADGQSCCVLMQSQTTMTFLGLIHNNTIWILQKRIESCPIE